MASGQVGVGDSLELWPGGRTVRVRGLHRHDRPVDRVGRGSRAALNLAGVRSGEIGRGSTLAEPGSLAASRILTVEVVPSGSAITSLKHRGRYALHIGTAEVAATLTLADPVGPTADGRPLLAQLQLAEPVAAVGGQPFVLRRPSPASTIGGGRVLIPVTRRLRRRDRVDWERSARLVDPDPVARVEAVLALADLGQGTETSLGRDADATDVEVRHALDFLRSQGRLEPLEIGPGRHAELPIERVRELEGRVLRALARLHGSKPRQSAIHRPTLDPELPDLAGRGLVDVLIRRLVDSGHIVAYGRTVALASHKPTLTQAERRLKDDLEDSLRVGGFQPPVVDELRARAGPRASTVDDLLALLADEGRAVPIGGGVWLHAEVESDLRVRIAEALADGVDLTMSDLRDLLATTRKFAVPIGEYLDRIGLTCRVGDSRRLATPAIATHAADSGSP